MTKRRKRTDQEQLVITLELVKIIYQHDRHRADLMLPALAEAEAIAERLRDREAEVTG